MTFRFPAGSARGGPRLASTAAEGGDSAIRLPCAATAGRRGLASRGPVPGEPYLMFNMSGGGGDHGWPR